MYSAGFCMSLTNYSRRHSVPVSVHGVGIGSSNPVCLQSMANTSLSDVQSSVSQCIRIYQAGAQLVRFSVPSENDIDFLLAIRQELERRGFSIPLVADVHFSAAIAEKVAGIADKVRINPGNYTARNSGETSNKLDLQFVQLIHTCRERGVAIRVGVNHGSLSARIMDLYGDTPMGMAESAMEFLRVCQREQYDQVVVSMKSSNVRVMVQATRLTASLMAREGMFFPLHIGVTEAGDGEDGRIKSAAGIGALLSDGLGDTIRVSLTEDPEKEIPVAAMLAAYAERLNNSLVLPEIPLKAIGYYEYVPRNTRQAGIAGGNQVPVVVGDPDTGADIGYWNGGKKPGAALEKGLWIVPESIWLPEMPAGFLPLFESGTIPDEVPAGRIMGFVRADFGTIKDLLLQYSIRRDPWVIVYEPKQVNIHGELRWLRHQLETAGCDWPVVISPVYSESDPDRLSINCAAGLGGTLIEGFGNGLWLRKSGEEDDSGLTRLAFGLLQACRSRMIKTEYIACPSCSRTHFNLMDTLSKIKEATSHLKNLRIGVMGCIVNGPGEMADADYGYVGSGKGRVTLYKGREMIRRGIDERDAVSALLELIKESGDWRDPV